MIRVPTRSAIEPFIRDGMVTAQRHPALPFTIYNYTHRCQFAKRWTDVTKACRGLIIADDGTVVARPFPKFFNLSEMPRSWHPPSKTFTVTTKEDGSLGILYPTKNGIAMATRGSFTGDQAVRATAMVQSYAHLPWELDRYTYLFEIIYPENRIVVDYGTDERLVMLAAIETKTGKDVELPAWYPHHVVEWPGVTDLAQLPAMARPNAEGFVVRFANSHRVKVKFDEYVRLHRLLTGVNARTIWEWLAAGDDISALIGGVPDEFYEWVKDTADGIARQFQAILRQCHADLEGVPRDAGRREQAAYITRQMYPAILFAMLDDKDYRAIAWKLVKPEAERPFRQDVDA